MLHPDNTLILIVDIQERLLPALHDGANFVANCVKFLTGVNALNLPQICTEQYPKGLGKTVPEIAAILNDAPIFEKTKFSAWTDDVQAAANFPENIIIIGCETHICVLQTVLELRTANVNVYLPQECLTSRTLSNKNNGITQIQATGATVSNIESLLFQLLGDAKHPTFKTISKLIQ